MKEIATHEFESPVRKETAYCVVADYGLCKNEMVMYEIRDREDDEPCLTVEWSVYDMNDNLIDVANIGLEYYDDYGTIVISGYDGVFQLPEQINTLFEKAKMKYESYLFED